MREVASENFRRSERQEPDGEQLTALDFCSDSLGCGNHQAASGG